MFYQICHLSTINIVNPPPSGHTINNDDNNTVMDTNFTSVVKRESNEAVISVEEHIIFSGDDQTSIKESLQEQESDWQDINPEPIRIPQHKIQHQISIEFALGHIYIESSFNTCLVFSVIIHALHLIYALRVTSSVKRREVLLFLLN